MSFTPLFVFTIYFEIWRSRWDLRDASPTYHCSHQRPICELEIQPKNSLKLYQSSSPPKCGEFCCNFTLCSHYCCFLFVQS